MGFFSKFKSKDTAAAKPKSSKSKSKPVQSNGVVPAPAPKPRWDDAWTRKEVEPEEVQELLRGCTQELKSKALDMPFLLLPFRPASDPSAARTFIRNYFSPDKGAQLVGARLEQELMLTGPMVLSCVMKWCWSRLAGGVVTWEAYELFRVGEQDSDMARDAFATFIPLSVETDARTKIIFDFFDLISAIAAHGQKNGMGGRKLSRLAGWWAFDQVDVGNGFEGGYKSWSSAADATSHLFFAYLRSLSPESAQGVNGIAALPMSLQRLVQDMTYPPESPPSASASKVVMVVDRVSPTPFALLRRAKNFEYRDEDRTLQQFSDFEDPVQALTDECRRILDSISSANQSAVSTTKASTSLGDASWSRFEDIGFSGFGDFDDDEPDTAMAKKRAPPQGLRTTPQTQTNDLGRPTTPSWADFLSSGFVDEPSSPAPRPLLLPPDKILPPIDIDSRRGKSSQSHRRPPEDTSLEPGELASINGLKLDDAFWWVWITSLAGEETTLRKSVFGRCALIETTISGGTWLVIEEMVKGAAPEPERGAYIAEKKSRFTFGKKKTMQRTKSFNRKPSVPEPFQRNSQASPMSKTSIGTDQHARIQAAAAALQQKHRQDENARPNQPISPRRGRPGDTMSTKTNSVFTLQPVIMSEAAPAMQWANSYDKKAIRAAYLGNNFTGKGSRTDLGVGSATNGSITPQPQTLTPKQTQRPDYGFPAQRQDPGIVNNRNLPALPPETPGENLQAPTSPPPPVPTAPLPAEPTVRPANHVAADAAEVPLPAATPMDPVEARSPDIGPEPEGEPLEPVRTVTEDQTNGQLSPSSPESKRTANKLQKKSGVRSFFGKKKTPPASAPQNPADSVAVAAARAAYTGPSMKPNYQPSNSLSRRLSGMGRRKTPPAATAMLPTNETNEESLPLPQPPAFQDSEVSLVESSEQRRADREFNTFDQQGPLDQPAFIPQDSPRREESPRPSFVAESEVSRPSTAQQDRGPHFEPPIGRGEYEPSLSDEEDRPPSPAEDRWAQIRKNAAERAGKMNDKHRESVDKTEDGEDSGEETIESRVARIKARVAELTGNMGGQEAKTAA